MDRVYLHDFVFRHLFINESLGNYNRDRLQTVSRRAMGVLFDNADRLVDRCQG